jgi:V8-like Glu-specific endopeptidase
VTATHPIKDYNGKKEFLIDAPTMPGTSGSPVLIIDENGYINRDGNYYPDEDRILFLGTLSAGPHAAPEGLPKKSDITATVSPHLPSNLGLVIKSSRILELAALF